MIVANGKYYLYRHIRNDKNEPFYIGIGAKLKSDIKNNTYQRAFSNKERNDFWRHIVAKTNYHIEILIESDDRIFIQQKEIEFIKLYGRRDLKTGVLCNLTDGGDSGLNRSQYAIDKQLATAKRNGTYQDMVDRMKKYAMKKGRKGSPVNKKTFLYTDYGLFCKEFNSREECGEFIESDGTHIAKIIKTKESHKGWIILNEYRGVKIDISQFHIRKLKEVEVVQICTKTLDFLYIYSSMTQASKQLNSNKYAIFSAIKLTQKGAGYYWAYRDNAVETTFKLNDKYNIWQPHYIN